MKDKQKRQIRGREIRERFLSIIKMAVLKSFVCVVQNASTVIIGDGLTGGRWKLSLLAVRVGC